MGLRQPVPVGCPLPRFVVVTGPGTGARGVLAALGRRGVWSHSEVTPQTETRLPRPWGLVSSGGRRTYEVDGLLMYMLLARRERLTEPQQALASISIVHDLPNAHEPGAICIETLEHLLSQVFESSAVRQTCFGKEPRQTEEHRTNGQNDLRLIEAAISIHVEDAEQEADSGNVVLARHHHHGTYDRPEIQKTAICMFRPEQEVKNVLRQVEVADS
mmetsp:Transcript_52149/g.122506  ORF Transcript_52149/g.122506 Transcript_52149/m.122506 type:complete len:216 (-) Transcript_52149:264-911(-)